MIEARKRKWSVALFRWYVKRYLRKHFFRVHFFSEYEKLELYEPLPVVGILNHSSWWDVLVGWHVTHHFFPFDSYAVMDEEQLERYRFFSRLGFYSINRQSKFSGVKEFLTYSGKLFARPGTAVWICPQGEIVSNDRRPVQFFPGAAHLVKHLGRAWVLPVALDYEFCQEPQPEAFVYAGRPVKVEAKNYGSVEELNGALEKLLAQKMDALREKTAARDFSSFRVILSGKKGVQKIYDWMTALRFKLKGKKFHSTHGEYQ